MPYQWWVETKEGGGKTLAHTVHADTPLKRDTPCCLVAGVCAWTGIQQDASHTAQAAAPNKSEAHTRTHIVLMQGACQGDLVSHSASAQLHHKAHTHQDD